MLSYSGNMKMTERCPMKRRIWLPKALAHFMVVLMVVAVVSIVALPWIVSAYVNYVYFVTGSSMIKYYFLGVLYVSGFLSLVVLYELRRVFQTVVEEDPFVARNVVSLKRIGMASLLIGLVFVTKAVLFLTFLTLIVIFVFALAALFCFVIADVFEEAVAHKHEIDLTI